MITVRIGDIFESNAQTLVNTVNCVGIMGKGIALEFKKRFPDVFEEYVQLCKLGKMKLGQPYLHKRLTPPWVLNFPTKEHWRSVSRLQDIVTGLQYLQRHYRDWGITSLAVPPLGCGQGQLEWRVVGPTLYRHLKQLDASREQPSPFREVQSYRISPGWVALVEILHGIEREPYHRPVGRVTFQKIAYFATESGIPTGLRYQRGSYGPYAAELKRHITALVNNSLIREERLGRMFAVRTGPTFHDAHHAYAEQLQQWRKAIEKVTDLFLRMNTQQAEIAATVHFAAVELRQSGTVRPTESQVLRRVMDWKQNRRPPLNEKQVALTIRNLNILSWLGAEVSDDLPVTEEDVLHV